MLGYNTAHHVHCELNLNSGRKVRLGSLDQWMTYGGWSEGVPSAEWNDRKIKSALQASGSNGILIPPVRREYLRTPGDMEGMTSFRDQVPEWLPMVTCVGRFEHTQPARDRDHSKYSSMLIVVWYQDEFCMPIDTGVMEQLRAVDWERVAYDVEV